VTEAHMNKQLVPGFTWQCYGQELNQRRPCDH